MKYLQSFDYKITENDIKLTKAVYNFDDNIVKNLLDKNCRFIINVNHDGYNNDFNGERIVDNIMSELCLFHTPKKIKFFYEFFKNTNFVIDNYTHELNSVYLSPIDMNLTMQLINCVRYNNENKKFLIIKHKLFNICLEDVLHHFLLYGTGYLEYAKELWNDFNTLKIKVEHLLPSDFTNHSLDCNIDWYNSVSPFTLRELLVGYIDNTNRNINEWYKIKIRQLFFDSFKNNDVILDLDKKTITIHDTTMPIKQFIEQI